MLFGPLSIKNREAIMNRLSLVATALLTIGTFAGGASAAGPSKADMEFCNQKAAQASKPSPVQPSTTNQPAKQPSTGTQTDDSKPGTPVSPGVPVQRAPATPQAGNNPSGGRITDSSQPGMTASQSGMAPIGEIDSAYKQAYLACISERTK